MSASFVAIGQEFAGEARRRCEEFKKVRHVLYGHSGFDSFGHERLRRTINFRDVGGRDGPLGGTGHAEDYSGG